MKGKLLHIVNKHITFRHQEESYHFQKTLGEKQILKNNDRKFPCGSSHHGAGKTNLTRNHEVVGSICGLAQWVKDLELL